MRFNERTDGALPKIDMDDPDAQMIHIEHTEDEAIAAVLASLGRDADASVGIYKQGPGGYRDLMYLTECLPAEYSLSRLQDEFGGGVFRIHVRNGGKLVANKEVKVAPPKSAQRASDPGLAQVQADVRGLMSVVEKLAAISAAPPVQPQQSRMDFIREMVAMKELFSNGGAPRQSDPIDMLVKLMEVQKMFGALGGDAEPGTMTVLMKALETLGPALQQSAAGRAVPAPPGYQPNPIAPMELDQQAFLTPEPGAVPPPTPPQDQDAHMLGIYINMLIAEAQQNIDPEAYALLITQKLAQQQIHELLDPADWFEKLSAFEPKVVPFREWFSDLREMVFSILTEESAADTTDENQSGGTDHAPAATANTNAQGNT